MFYSMLKFVALHPIKAIVYTLMLFYALIFVIAFPPLLVVLGPFIARKLWRALTRRTDTPHAEAPRDVPKSSKEEPVRREEAESQPVATPSVVQLDAHRDSDEPKRTYAKSAVVVPMQRRK